MGNFPLCIPKQDGIVFSDCPSTPNDFLLHHRFQLDFDSLRNDQGRGGPQSSQGMDDTAVLGIELDQDSVCIQTIVYAVCVDLSSPPPQLNT